MSKVTCTFCRTSHFNLKRYKGSLMKKIHLLILFISLTTTVFAQGVIVNQDGTISIQTGSTIVNSNGSVSTVHGSIIVNSDGTHSIVAGSSIINANGSTSTITSPLLTDKPDENPVICKEDLTQEFPAISKRSTKINRYRKKQATYFQLPDTVQSLRHPNSTDPFRLNQDKDSNN